MGAVMRLLIRWIIGIGIGTLIIAVTSPIFVRSYVPRQINRGHATLSAGVDYRWRSEGYATTQIGPLGMPGQTDWTARRAGQRRIVLWGDSQAEGVCVDDRDKIFSLTERLINGDQAGVTDDQASEATIFPFTQSGEDLADWLPQMSWAEANVDVDIHVILMTEMPDLRLENLDTAPMAINATQNWRATHFPAFVIQSARHLLTEANDETPRQLRFGLGPVNATQVVASEIDQSHVVSSETDWAPTIDAITASTDQPVMLLYAPVLPRIVGGQAIWDDADADDFDRLKFLAEANGMTVVDVRSDFRQSASQGRWTHGFHNGQFGAGHLNETGNTIVARRLSEALASRFGAAAVGN
jgi:hypothetical protein